MGRVVLFRKHIRLQAAGRRTYLSRRQLGSNTMLRITSPPLVPCHCVLWCITIVHYVFPFIIVLAPQLTPHKTPLHFAQFQNERAARERHNQVCSGSSSDRMMGLCPIHEAVNVPLLKNKTKRNELSVEHNI